MAVGLGVLEAGLCVLEAGLGVLEAIPGVLEAGLGVLEAGLSCQNHSLTAQIDSSSSQTTPEAPRSCQKLGKSIFQWFSETSEGLGSPQDRPFVIVGPTMRGPTLATKLSRINFASVIVGPTITGI